MKVWEVDLKEPKSSLDNVWECLTVLAVNFEECIEKVVEYIKSEYSDLPLEIVRIEAIREVTIE